jgi:formylglycine-generating enzyme required for sulfatase activity
MLGSVREWCADWMGPYPPGPVTDPKGPDTGRARINRGGSTNTAVVQYRQVHPTYRWYYTPEFKDNDLGFRVLRIAE